MPPATKQASTGKFKPVGKPGQTNDEKKVSVDKHVNEAESFFEFPMPEFTDEEIIDQFLNVPGVEHELAMHRSHPRFIDYIRIANIGRAERNVWSIFRKRCETQPEIPAIAWYDSAGRLEAEWSYGEMYDRIRKLAHWIHHEKRAGRGDRVVLVYAPSLEFFIAFWACLSLGIVAVPVCPPDPFQPVSDVAIKLKNIIASCEPKFLLSHSAYLGALEAGKEFNEARKSSKKSEEKLEFDLYALEMESSDEIPDNSEWRSFEFQSHHAAGLTLAFLQYTSGSTGMPKGVMVAHVNIVFNALNCTQITQCQKTFPMFKSATTVSWLPHFHDMGLIGFHIAPLLVGTPVSYFSPLDFLSDPLMWLRVMSDLGRAGRTVNSGGPPFALDLCAKRIASASASEIGKLDLSSISAIIVGAEPIRLSSLTNFSKALEPYNFSPNTIMPAYGLAENVLHAFCKMSNAYPPVCVYVSLEELRDSRVVEVEEGSEGGKWLVSSGEFVSQDPVRRVGLPLDGNIMVVDPLSRCECDGATIGEIWLYGRSKAAGYWQSHEATQATFQGKCKEIKTPQLMKHQDKSWTRTGDLGAIHNGQLYVTGRLKDLIIVNGANFYPADIEELVHNCHENVRAGCVAAVQVPVIGSSKSDAEGLVIILELRDKPQSSSSDAPSKVSESGKVKLTKNEMAVAQKLFKQTAKLPTVLRGPAIRGLARLGAWWTRVPSDGKHLDDSSPKSAKPVSRMGYTDDEILAVDRAVRKAILATFALPVHDVVIVQSRTILKTSSGKIRRAANGDALTAGDFKSHIIHQSTSASKFMSSKPTSASSSATTAVKAPVKTASKSVTKPAASSSCCQPMASSIGTSSSAVKPELSADAVAAKERKIAEARAALEAMPVDSSRPPLVFEDVKKRVAAILGEELKIGDAGTVMSLSESFEFDEDSPLDEYGLDSLTAMRIAGRFTTVFELRVPLSPFMFLNDPTLNGMSRVICRVHQTKPAATSAAARAAARNVASEPVSRPATAQRPLKQTVSKPVQVEDEVKYDAESSLHSRRQPAERGMACILGLGTALPGPGAPQVAITEIMIDGMELDAKKAKMMRTIGSTTQIERRFSVLPSIENIYFDRKGLGNNEGIETRNTIFKEEAPKLAKRAAEKALADWGGDRKDITHVIAVTCTGIIVPGLECGLMFDLDLSTTAQRVSLQFMGCFGALSGIKTAKAFAEADAKARILVVCCELCSLHMQLDDRIDNLVGSALFADGSGAIVVGQPKESEHTYYELHENHSVIIPDTGSMMAWDLTRSGMAIGLGKEIPSAIYSSIDEFVYQLLSLNEDAFAIDYTDMKWALHPGGPMIIEAIAQRLGIDNGHMEEVWSVLRNYGNMSSATLMFVLDEMRKSPMGGAWVPSLAFGPGLNIEGALFRATDGPMQSARGRVIDKDHTFSVVDANLVAGMNGNTTGLL